MQQPTTLFEAWKAARLGSAPPVEIGVGTVLQSSTKQFVMRFTPEDAKALLQHVHPRQRKVSERRVKHLLRAMQSGQWHEPPFTFDSIAFDTEGRLCNGRHRLTALAQHDKPLSFFVIIGVKSPADLPLPEGDSGAVRPKHFVAGIDRNNWAVLTYLARCVYTDKTPARTDVQLLYPMFAAALAAIPRTTTHSPAASIRAAFVFSWTEANGTLLGSIIAEQWRAYCRVEVAAMWPSIARLYKKIHEARAVKSEGGGEQDFRFQSALYALRNPEAMKILRQADAYQIVRQWVARKMQQEAA